MPKVSIQNVGKDKLTGPVGNKTVTIPRGGRYTFSTACDAVQFLNNADQAGVYDTQQGAVIEQINRKAESEGCPDRVNPMPAPVTQDNDPPANPPAQSDSPEAQGAPAASPAAAADVENGPYGELGDVRQPTEALHDRANPASEGEIYDGELANGKSQKDAQQSVDKAKRGDPPAGHSRSSHSGGQTGRSTLEGDPVELFSGQLYLITTDLDVPSPFLPLRIRRVYLSGLPYFGPLGFNWDHNWNIYIRELTNGNVARWNGRLHEHEFVWNGSVFEPPAGVFERLTRKTGQEPGYTIRAPNGLVMQFLRPPNWTDSERIPLVSLSDRGGNTVALRYDNENRLQYIRDDDGRRIDFLYGTCGFLESVQDQAGRVVHYYHDQAAQHLVAIRLPPTADFPEGLLAQYEYDDHPSHIALRHNIVRAIDHAGNTIAINEYGDDPADPSFNRIVSQIQGGYSYEFDYEQIQWVPHEPIYTQTPAQRTAVAYPDGSLWTYTFNYRGDLLDERFRLNIDRSYRVVITQRGYDAQGNVTSVVYPDGARTDFTFDHAHVDPLMRGNLLKVERRSAPTFPVASRIVHHAEYDPEFQYVRRILSEDGAETLMLYDFDLNPDPANRGDLMRVKRPATTLPDGSQQQAVTLYESNARGQTSAITYPEGARDQLIYEAVGSPRSGLLREYQADVAGTNEITRYTYDNFGYPATTTEPGGAITTTHYNSHGHLELEELPAVDGIVDSSQFFYCVQGCVARRLRPRGDYDDGVIAGKWIEDMFTTDPLGHRIKTVIGSNTALPRENRYTPDFRGNETKTVDAMGAVTERCFDERGLLLSLTQAAGSADEIKTRYFYDVAGRLVRWEEPGGRTTKIDHDAFGRPAHIYRPNGSVQTLVWGSEDRLLESRIEGDPGDGGPSRLLMRRRFDSDEQGRRIRKKEASYRDDPNTAIDLVTEYFYDRNDRLYRVKNARAASATIEYDGRNRIHDVTDAIGNTTTTTYDGAGNIASIKRTDLEPAGARTRTWLLRNDARRRLRSCTRPNDAVTELDYDARNLLIERREPFATVLRMRHGLLGEVLEKMIDPAGLAIATHQEFDPCGRLVRVTDPTGEITTWTRDMLGRETGITLPGGNHWHRCWGPLGTVIHQAMPSGSQFHFEYEPGNRHAIKMTCQPAVGVEPVPDHTYGYDGLGRPVAAATPGRAITRKYDSRNRLVAETALGRSVLRFYDDLAGTTESLLPDGRRERIVTDVAGRPSEISLVKTGVLGGKVGSLARFTYGGVNRLYKVDHANGVGTELVYDDATRLIRVSHAANNQTVESARYRYDELGHRRVAQLTANPPLNRVHTFDRRMRLVNARWEFPLAPLPDVAKQAVQDADITATVAAAQAAVTIESFSADLADSRSKRIHVDGKNSVQTIYGYAPGHQEKNAGAAQFGYYADGPRASDPARDYDIDALGRVVRVRDHVKGGVLFECQFDAFSRLASGAEQGKPFERCFLDGQWVYEESITAVSRQRTLRPDSPVPLLEISKAGAITPLVDGGLSVVCLLNDAGDVVERFRFEAFGRPGIFDATGTARTESAFGFAPIFAGMSYLSGAGLYVAGARLYDPEEGSFLSRDPILYRDSPSPYLYAVHNPVDYFDPYGTNIKNYKGDVLPDLDLQSLVLANRDVARQFQPHELVQSVFFSVSHENRTDWVKQNVDKIKSLVPGFKVGDPLAYGIRNDDVTALFDKEGQYVGEYNVRRGAVPSLINPFDFAAGALASRIAPIFTGLSKSTIAMAEATQVYESISYSVSGVALTESQASLFSKALEVAENASIPAGGGGFWSRAAPEALAYARGTGTNMIQTVPLGESLAALGMKEAGIPWSVEKDAWRIASTRWAAAGQGTQAAFVEGVIPESLYLETELPTMAELENVSSLRLMRGIWPEVEQYGIGQPNSYYSQYEILFSEPLKW